MEGPSDLKEQSSYLPIADLLNAIEGPNGDACRRLYEDMRARFEISPGSSHNHQAWPGGYVDHITDAMNIGAQVYHLYNSLRPLPFPLSDVLLIVFLHDLEKPYRYTDVNGTEIPNPPRQSKDELERFKLGIMTQYGIELTPQQANALEFVEGIRDHKYSNQERRMGELAVICHIADLTSARLWFNHPLPTDDPWQGSQRINPAAQDTTLPSEWY